MKPYTKTILDIGHSPFDYPKLPLKLNRTPTRSHPLKNYVVLSYGGKVPLNSSHPHLSRRCHLPATGAKGMHVMVFATQTRSRLRHSHYQFLISRITRSIKGGELKSKPSQVFRRLLQWNQTTHSRPLPRIPICRRHAL